MPAGLLKNDTMVSGRNIVPWHEIGTVVEGLMTFEAVLAKAGLDWEVEKVPAFFDGKNLAPEYNWIIRKDNRQVLGSVGKIYEPTQHTTDLRIMESLVGTGEAMYDTAGSLWGNKRIWISAKVPNGMFWVKLPNGSADQVDDYLLVTDSHDGSGAFTVANTMVRVVCANTLHMGLSSAKNTFKARHTKNIEERSQEAAKILKVNLEYRDALRAQSQSLADRPADADFVKAFLNALVPIPAVEPGDSTRGETIAKETQAKIRNIYETADNLEHAHGTVWGLFNAVAEYTDHGITGKNTDRSSAAENRMNRVVYSTNLTDRAFALLTAKS